MFHVKKNVFWNRKPYGFSLKTFVFYLKHTCFPTENIVFFATKTSSSHQNLDVSHTNPVLFPRENTIFATKPHALNPQQNEGQGLFRVIITRECPEVMITGVIITPNWAAKGFSA
jgi:hypothetical protein